MSIFQAVWGETKPLPPNEISWLIAKFKEFNSETISCNEFSISFLRYWHGQNFLLPDVVRRRTDGLAAMLLKFNLESEEFANGRPINQLVDRFMSDLQAWRSAGFDICQAETIYPITTAVYKTERVHVTDFEIENGKLSYARVSSNGRTKVSVPLADLDSWEEVTGSAWDSSSENGYQQFQVYAKHGDQLLMEGDNTVLVASSNDFEVFENTSKSRGPKHVIAAWDRDAADLHGRI